MSIELNEVSKIYKKTLALDQVSLTIEPGKIYGLLGRNGAGKTTVLNLITGRIFPTRGKITIDGEKAIEHDEAQAKVFFVGELNYYPGNMKVQDVFYWAANFYDTFDTAKASRLSDYFHLDPKNRLDTLPTGYRSVVKSILALSVGTPYIIMDEPFLGMDAWHREQFYKELKKTAEFRPQTTFVISTHMVEEIIPLIQEVIVLKRGRLLKQESLEEFKQSGFYVCGEPDAVREYCKGRRILAEDSSEEFKIALEGSMPDSLPEGLRSEEIPLQKLFIYLTGDQGL